MAKPSDYREIVRNTVQMMDKWKTIADNTGHRSLDMLEFCKNLSTPEVITKMVKKDFNGLQQLHFEYNYWVTGDKIYEIHPNLIDRFKMSNLKNVPTELCNTPFDTFMLKFPEGHLSFISHEGKKLWVEELIISKVNDLINLQGLNVPCINILYLSGDDMAYFKITLTKKEIHECVNESIRTTNDIENKFKIELNSKTVLDDDLRNIFEMVLKCILYITGANADVEWVGWFNEEKLKAKIARCPNPKKKKRLEKDLKNNKGVYKVGYKIVLSREEQIAYNYARKGLRKLSIRFIVQGHYKHQPYGEKRSKRKLIFVNPFWKGPEYSEIVNKPHLVK